MAERPVEKLSEDLGDGPVDQKFVNVMHTLAHAVDHLLNGTREPKPNGFILIVFPFSEVGDRGRANYISNAKRDQVVTMLKQQIARFEGMPDVTGHG